MKGTVCAKVLRQKQSWCAPGEQGRSVRLGLSEPGKMGGDEAKEVVQGQTG